METARDDPQSPDEDPRDTDVGQGGYPEEQQPGTEPAPGERKRNSGSGDDAPSTSSPHEGGPEEATGNPGAAGG